MLASKSPPAILDWRLKHVFHSTFDCALETSFMVLFLHIGYSVLVVSHGNEKFSLYFQEACKNVMLLKC